MAAMATSSMIEAQVKALLEENNIEARIIKAQVFEVDEYLKTTHVDLIIPNNVYVTDKAPVVSGFNFITGINVEETKQQILDVLKKEDSSEE